MKRILVFVLLIGGLISNMVNAHMIKFKYNPSADLRLDKNIKIKKVSIAGTFNNWNKNSNIMKKNKAGAYSVEVELEPGLYYYKIVVNNKIWLEDLNADTNLRQSDGQPGKKYNSGIKVDDPVYDKIVSEKDYMNLDLAEHKISDKYYKIIEPNKIKITLRTLKNDVDKVTIVYKIKNKFIHKQMPNKITKMNFDYFSITLEFENNNNPYFEYYFELCRKTVCTVKKDIEYKNFIGYTGLVKNVPDWSKDVVWYQIFPERFYNGDKSNDPELKDINEGENIKGWKIKNWGSDWYAMDKWEKENYKSVYQSVFRRRYGGDLQGVIDKLDYIKQLGISAIYLNPIFRSPSLHKYDGSCFHHIEETFGPNPEGDRKLIEQANETENPETWIWTSADKLFLKLIKECHKRNIKIIIDGVFNHSGRTFFAFRDILKNKQKSRYADWYEITKWNVRNKDGFKYKGWYGYKYLPEFKRDKYNMNPGYKQYVFDITKRWLAPFGKQKNGVDGFRLDVAFCIPHNFWKDWRREVKKNKKDAYLTAEVVEIEPDYLQGDEFDAMMNYPFAYAAVSFFVDKNKRISVTEFDEKLEKLINVYPEPIPYVMQNLYSSHDCARLQSIIVNPDMDFNNFGKYFNKSKIQKNKNYRLDRGDSNDLQIHKLMVIFQMTFVGAPMVYYGNEVGMTGANDPDCRKPMLWNEIKYKDEKVHPVKGKSRPVEKNVVNAELLKFYKKMIAVRNNNIELRRGDFDSFLIDNKDKIYGFKRSYKNKNIYVVINNNEHNEKVMFSIKEKKIVNLLNNKTYENKDGNFVIDLKSKWAAVMKPE